MTEFYLQELQFFDEHVLQELAEEVFVPSGLLLLKLKAETCFAVRLERHFGQETEISLEFVISSNAFPHFLQ